MTYAKMPSPQKANENSHGPSGANAVRTLPAVPVLQKAASDNQTKLDRKNPSTLLMQMKNVSPKLQDGTILDYSKKGQSNDDQAPSVIDTYEYIDPVAVNTREDALTQIRDIYAQIGVGLQGDPGFLSRGTFRTFAYGNAANAPAVYNVLLNHQKVSADIPDNDQAKMNAYKNFLGRNILREHLSMFLEEDGIELKDPLKIDISVPYATGKLTATVTYTEALRGYVTAIKEETGGVQTVNASIERRDPYQKNVHTQVGAIRTYSSTHHLTGSRTASDEIASTGMAKTHYEQERGVDAMTKVIAEGGRFECVRALGTAIKNTTRFYVERVMFPSDEKGYPYIEFKKLYRLWTKEFGARYRIPNDVVIEYILANVDDLPHMTLQEISNADAINLED